MPECPTGIVVAKPKRHAWALEEAWDLAVLSHPEGRAEATRFPGVILVYTPDRDPVKLSIVAARGERGFIQRIVPGEVCLSNPSGSEVLEAVKAVAGKLVLKGVKEARLIVSLRGEGKKVVAEDAVNHALREAGLTVSRRSKASVAVESVDTIFLIAAGITYKCGLNCTLIYLKM